MGAVAVALRPSRFVWPLLHSCDSSSSHGGDNGSTSIKSNSIASTMVMEGGQS